MRSSFSLEEPSETIFTFGIFIGFAITTPDRLQVFSSLCSLEEQSETIFTVGIIIGSVTLTSEELQVFSSSFLLEEQSETIFTFGYNLCYTNPGWITSIFFIFT